MSIILKAENISKQYRLGNVGTGTLSHDLNRWWHKIRGKENPYAKVGAVNNRSANATEDYVWALKNINFKVKKGEVLGIIGKNGAGKSTLLKILSRVTSPTTGSIKAKGRIASLLEVGTGFHPELTGKENIYLNGAILGMNKAEINIKVDEIIEFSGCQMYIDTPVKRYSSGMRVRLAFAVAAFMEPDILVIDEVLAVGDAEFQKKAVGKMQDIAQGEGRTVLFVSHDMAAIKSLCSRVIVLTNGFVSYDGNAIEAITFYLEDKSNVGQTEYIKQKENLNLQVEISNFRINSEVKTGAPFNFSFNVRSSISIKCEFAIGFRNTKGHRIFQIYSGHNDVYYILESGISSVSGMVDKLPLVNGEYVVSLWIGYGKIEYDFKLEALNVIVAKGSLIGNRLVEYRNFPVVSNTNWTLNE
jgi:lipopolysaccharide transport system ATP-binding protein